MKKIYGLMTILLSMLAMPVLAQSWDGPGAQPVKYITHQTGDGTTASGGTPPAYARAPADRPTTISKTGFTFTTANGVDTTANEMKFRIVCGTSHSNDADFILAPGIPKWMHKHSYAGNKSTNQDSTYASLRDHPYSTCQGGPLWNQGYWDPSVCKKAGNGQQCLKSDFHLFYYARGMDFKGKLVSLPNFTRLIIGKNPMDMTNESRKPEIPPGYTGPFDGFQGWMCGRTDDNGNVLEFVLTDDGKEYADGFKTIDGKDPFGGRCKTGYRIHAQLMSPECWDGQNLSSPNGRDHFRYKTSLGSDTKHPFCPDGWYDVPDLSVRVVYSLKKDAEYFVDDWYLSSDRMWADPAKWLRNGTSMHADWVMSVDPDVWHRVMASCLAIPAAGYTPIGGDCATGNIDMTTSLESNTAPAGSGYTTPIVSANQRRMLSAKDRWFAIDSGTKGPFHIMNH